MTRSDPSSGSPLWLKVVLVLLSVPALASALGFWFYGLDSRHDSRDSIWPEVALELTPPTATDITLQRDLLDHFATYTVGTSELDAFTERRFGSAREVGPADPGMVGSRIGCFDWMVPKGCLAYSCWTSNGAATTYYHDPATGSTYQASAHW